MSRRLRYFAIGLSILGQASIGARAAHADAPVVIEIDRFQFGPQEITVEAGTVVEWLNRDQTVHNVVSQQAGIVSPGLDTGDHFSIAFDKPGDYSYLCALHPHMTGVVHVKAHSP